MYFSENKLKLKITFITFYIYIYIYIIYLEEKCQIKFKITAVKTVKIIGL